MFIRVSQLDSGRYGFVVGESPADGKDMLFDSTYDFWMVSGLPSTTQTFAEAHAYALRIAEQHPQMVMAKKAAAAGPEGDKAKSFFKNWSRMAPDDGLVFASLNAIRSLPGADKVVSFQSEIVKTAKRKVKSDEEKAIGVLRTFAEAAAMALSSVHSMAHVGLAEEMPDSGGFRLVISESGTPTCSAVFNDKLLLEDVQPSDEIRGECPYHSMDFFERYWEPIAHAIGHVYLPSENVVAVFSHPSSRRRRLAAWDISRSEPCWVMVSIPSREDKKVWRVSCQQPVKMAGSMVGMLVRCDRKDLPLYYGRTGTVVGESKDDKELAVDFGRGLGVMTVLEGDVSGSIT